MNLNFYTLEFFGNVTSPIQLEFSQKPSSTNEGRMNARKSKVKRYGTRFRIPGHTPSLSTLSVSDHESEIRFDVIQGWALEGVH